MTAVYLAPALTADWLNAWLAAIGVTVLLPATRLSWVEDTLPHAVFHSPGGLPPLHQQVADALPRAEELGLLAIARVHPDTNSLFERKVSMDSYRDRSVIARRYGDPSLAATVTDITPQNRDNRLRQSHFDPPVPKGVTLHDRLLRLREAIDADNAAQAVEQTLARGGRRVKANGLGFDYRRIPSPTDPAGDVWVDPVVELLAYLGLTLFPTRGDGFRFLVRGWQPGPPRKGSFTWPAWDTPLSAPGIDALLDEHWRGKQKPPTVHAVYQVVPYQPRATKDLTRGYASERIR